MGDSVSWRICYSFTRRDFYVETNFLLPLLRDVHPHEVDIIN